jgi:hypothetical protein
MHVDHLGLESFDEVGSLFFILLSCP